MFPTGWTQAQRWLFALKPASWPKLLVPAFFGAAIGGVARGSAPLGALLLVVVFTVAQAIYIVFLNDVADEDVDRLKRRMFPKAGSPKVLPDGILDRGMLLIAGTVAGTYAFVVSLGGALVLGRPALVLGAILALGLFAAYSLPPIRLNYRGGGEVLEALGVGVVLPWYAAYAVSGEVLPAGTTLLPGLTALALGSAVASGLSDEDSDRRGGKRTVVSLLGNRLGRRATQAMLVLGALLWWVPALRGQVAWQPVLVGSLVVLGYLPMVSRLSAPATSRAFKAIAEYKGAVNSAIRDASLVLGVGLLVHGIIAGP
jgi:4-hydroxybenzoate polyprenyltransferase